MDGAAWWAAVHGVTEGRTQLSDFTLTFHFPALEKEMATHSSVLACRIPGTGEPGGLPSMGLHRVGHDWSDLAAAAGVFCNITFPIFPRFTVLCLIIEEYQGQIFCHCLWWSSYNSRNSTDFFVCAYRLLSLCVCFLKWKNKNILVYYYIYLIWHFYH